MKPPKTLALILAGENPVEGVALDELEVVLAALTCGLKDVVEHKGGCDDGRAAVELEAVHLVDVGPPAELVAFLEHGDVVTGGEQPGRRPERAEAAADDDNFFLHISLYGASG